MLNWAIASDLDRVDHHRTSPEWVANLWRDSEARLLKIDNMDRNVSALRVNEHLGFVRMPGRIELRCRIDP